MKKRPQINFSSQNFSVDNSFKMFQVCYWSYLSRTCLEIVLSIGLFLIYFCWGMPNLEREIDCDVHGIRHTCVLPNHQVSDKKMYLENLKMNKNP